MVDRFGRDFRDAMDRMVASALEANKALAGLAEALADEEEMQTITLDDADDTPSGYVAFRGKGTYWAKERLKRFGAYWDPPNKRWLVPKANERVAAAAVAYAQSVGRELTDEEIDYGLPPRKKRETAASFSPMMTCFECGQRYREKEVKERGGVVEEWYCGCCEEKNKPRRLPWRTAADF